jgi:hypothetical protein
MTISTLSRIGGCCFRWAYDSCISAPPCPAANHRAVVDPYEPALLRKS